MLSPISPPLRLSKLSETVESLSQEESEGTNQRFEFIAEDGHANDSNQFRKESQKSAAIYIHIANLIIRYYSGVFIGRFKLPVRSSTIGIPLSSCFKALN
jgi:hypothetical protein